MLHSKINPSNDCNQGLLEVRVRNLFPQYRIIKNARKEASVTNPNTGEYLEVDVWLPEIDLCFEYQDDYHYKPAWYSQIPLASLQQKDDIKKSKLQNNYQTLIIVPYWWDGLIGSLRGTIRFQRPDLIHLGTDVEISNLPIFVEDHKQLMLASFPDMDMMSHSYWWVGEKWDGVRCFWHSAEQVLYSRYSIHISIHSPKHDLFGCMELDCELWSGRGFFCEAQKVLSNPYELSNRLFLRLVIFDEASLHLQSQPFEMRYSLIMSYLHADHPTLLVAPRFLCAHETLLTLMQVVTQSGGEGLVARKPYSRYLPGRSSSLYKIKAFYNEQEALVVKVNDDESLVLQLPSQAIFSVAREDCLLTQRISKGDIVTFSFDFLKRIQPLLRSTTDATIDSPSNPVVHRVRSDLSWDDVMCAMPLSPLRRLRNETETHLVKFHYNLADSTNCSKSAVNNNTSQSWKHLDDRRLFFDKFAAYKGMDPLNPVFWYGVSIPELRKYSLGYRGIANYYGKLSTALMQLYPNIGFQKSLFRGRIFFFSAVKSKLHFLAKKTIQSWKHEGIRRAYFDNFAASKGMDSLNPTFWYNVSITELNRYQKGYQGIANYYGSKLWKVLTQLYPNIGLKENRFKVQSWKLKSERRLYFDKFATAKGMDPLNPVFWYNTPTSELRKFHAGYFQHIVNYHGGKLSAALMQLYPNIGLQQHRFKAIFTQSWKLESARRKYFDSFANSQAMDSLNPVFWYSVTTRQLIKYFKGSQQIVTYYGGKLSVAIMRLYPNIGLQKHLFKGQVQS